jgi:hypothetical protein
VHQVLRLTLSVPTEYASTLTDPDLPLGHRAVAFAELVLLKSGWYAGCPVSSDPLEGGVAVSVLLDLPAPIHHAIEAGASVREMLTRALLVGYPLFVDACLTLRRSPEIVTVDVSFAVLDRACEALNDAWDAPPLQPVLRMAA